MSPIALLLLAYAFSKGKGGYIPPSGMPGTIPPVVPPGTPVTGMIKGQRYTLTVLFAHPGEPPAAQLKTDLESSMQSAAFTVNPSLTHIAQNTDGTWSGQVTGLYNGGSVPMGGGGKWTLLQLASA